MDNTTTLSKEDILKNIHKKVVINWEKVFKQNPTIIQSAYDAMDEYAEQVSKERCIAFAEWLKDNHYTRNMNSGEKRWYKYFSINEELPSGVMMSTPVCEYFTSEQLFEKFIKETQTNLNP